MEIAKLIKNKIDAWERSYVTIVDGLDFNAWDTIRRIEFLSNSKYLSGQKDKRGKLKPFYNILNYRVNIATRATDIDTKDIQIVADEPQFMGTSFILQKEVYNWMKTENFSYTLNQMGYIRAKYGGVLVKKCIYQEEGEEEELEIETVDWRNVIVDPINPTDLVIEKHFMTAEQLSKKRGVWKNVESAMEMANKSKDGRLEVYEAHGMFPKSYASEINNEYEYTEGDNLEYAQQCFFMTFKGRSKESMMLYHSFEDEVIYKYLEWEKVFGRLGRGIMEDGFEAQIWTNDAVIKEKEAMELGSKVVFTTTDPNIQNNILSETDNGQIIKRVQGSEFSIANTITNALPEFSRLIQSWDTQIERTSSTFAAISGETMPSNTPYRTTAILNQEATSMFDYRREEMGIFLVEIFTDWTIPYLLKKFNKKHILAAEFTPEELKGIDSSYANFRANEEVMKVILSGKPVYAEDYEKLVQGYKDMLMKSKQIRFLDVPKGFYKGWQPKVTIITTGEQKNKAVILESLNNVLMTVAKAPQVLTDPTLSQVFAKILEVSGSGISPLSLGLGAAKEQQMQLQQTPMETPQVTPTA